MTLKYKNDTDYLMSVPGMAEKIKRIISCLVAIFQTPLKLSLFAVTDYRCVVFGVSPVCGLTFVLSISRLCA